MPQYELPRELAHFYGGPIGFASPCVYANFVSSIDGVTAIPSLPQSNRLIAAGSEHDRFVMALLRACADAILIGAGTFHASPRTQWTPEHAYPAMGGSYAQLRRRLGLTPEPELAVLSGRGTVDPGHPGLQPPAVVLTSDGGAARLAGRLPARIDVVSLGPNPSGDAGAVLRALRERGHRLILCEGGPTLFGMLVEAGLLDELFLTVAPRLAGRIAASPRLSLVEDAELLPGRPADGRMRSVRIAGSHLFLRYAMIRPSQSGAIKSHATTEFTISVSRHERGFLRRSLTFLER